MKIHWCDNTNIRPITIKYSLKNTRRAIPILTIECKQQWRAPCIQYSLHIPHGYYSEPVHFVSLIICSVFLPSFSHSESDHCSFVVFFLLLLFLYCVDRPIHFFFVAWHFLFVSKFFVRLMFIGLN